MLLNHNSFIIRLALPLCNCKESLLQSEDLKKVPTLLPLCVLIVPHGAIAIPLILLDADAKSERRTKKEKMCQMSHLEA